MTEKKYTVTNLLANLMQKSLLAEDQVTEVKTYLENQKPTPGVPGYIQLLIAIGAWTSAIFLLIFLGLSEIINFDHRPNMLIWGLIFLGGSLGLNYKNLGIYTRQLALAFSVTAHALILIGIGLHGAAIAMTAVALCLVLYPLYRDSLHRFLSCLLAFTMLTTWALDSTNHIWLQLLIAAELLGLGFLYNLMSQTRKWAAPTYAVSVSLPMTLLLGLAPEYFSYFRGISWWPSQITLSLWLGFLFYRTFQMSQRRKREPLFWAMVCALLLGIVSTPGILAAIGILVIGYSLSDKLLSFLGLLFLPVFICYFYYNLNLALDKKSYILMASGAVLLLGRYLLRKRPWTGEMEQ